MRIDYPNFEIDIDDYVELKKKEIERDINSQSTDFIMNVNEEMYVKALVSNYLLEMEVFYETLRIQKVNERKLPETFHNVEFNNMPNKYIEYTICLKYKFSGNIDLLRVKPTNCTVPTRHIPIEVYGDELLIYFSLKKRDMDNFDVIKGNVIGDVFINIENARGQITSKYNDKLTFIIRNIFRNVKNEKEKEYETFSKFGIETKSTSDNTYHVNIVKKVITIPELLPNKEVAYSIREDIYREIIQAIYGVYKNYEKYESIYKDKTEEDLRDLILPLLQTMFINTHSSGETFNKKGKTDILTNAPDGSSILIAECKIWHGEKYLLDAIDQLLSRYITWRDNRTALIVFVHSKNMMDVINNAKAAIMKHRCYVRSNGISNDSSFSYTFHIDGDNGSNISLELMLFHYPQD